MKNRAFNCKNAHKELAKLKEFEYKYGVVVIARGHRRILLSVLTGGMPGAKTICINSADYRNISWNDKKMKKLFSKLFGEFIKDRHLNP